MDNTYFFDDSMDDELEKLIAWIDDRDAAAEEWLNEQVAERFNLRQITAGPKARCTAGRHSYFNRRHQSSALGIRAVSRRLGCH